ncbi:glycoside hydrolase family 43 protein [Actinoplanes sp. NBRC 101535]|uniref:glycoside hydrolase family 43 protein n=1 Tax=Actinoplanes sp. NBRC 101535 TaxID=3032196 RepID=UPI0024A15CAA|nr:glycoside hydrolase family 43 protein [Actinoplanes sp. NBRC 101535]GLY08504.1 xylan 1,4-beta-xylosidase [Actinoplanes sp. NBRC 101535]
MIINPILPGFHSDPSAIRADGRYVVATSTFEWFPGVSLHTSADLRTWQPIGAALDRPEQLDLRGVPDSGGVWAPALSYHDGLYWLVYSIVRTMTGAYKDLDNYLVTATDPAGPWSDPVHLNCSGFDPSLFHAADGRRYLVNLNWDHRADRFSFGGILLQEYDHERRELVGNPDLIYTSEELMEGSHLFEHDGWFYLMLAEGGTGYHHGIRLARSRNLHGPYETDPSPLLTSRDDPRAVIHKAGHGQLVTTADGEHYLVHLGARPVMGRTGLRSPLGRETFLQRVIWDDDGWLRLADGGHHPYADVPAPRAAPQPAPQPRDQAFRGPEWVSLRGPAQADLSSRPGWLRLRGRESLDSLFHQSLLACRLTSLTCMAEVTVDADPQRFTEMAGLVVYYNTTGYHYLAVTHHEDRGRVVGVISKSPAGTIEHVWRPAGAGPLRLHAEVDGLRLVLSVDDDRWEVDLDALSDEIGPPLRFTGTMIGVCVQDLARRRFTADFTGFSLTGAPR